MIKEFINCKPIHLAIILDGNRRFAKKYNKSSLFGHKKGIEKINLLFKWCENDFPISNLTMFIFSTENWNRSKKEISNLMILVKNFLNNDKKWNIFLANKKININIIGDTKNLENDIKKTITNFKNKLKTK